MKIDYQSLRNPRRTPIRDGFPLDTPFLVHVEPAAPCNLRCSFCPTGRKDDNLKRGLMDYALFERMVDGFKTMPHRIKQLTFCGNGEPLLHPRLVDMLRLAKKANIADRIWLRTNGLLLTPELSYALAEVDIDLIGVSIKAMSSEGYEKVTGVWLDYEKLRGKIADLSVAHMRAHTRIYVNTVDIHTPEDTAKFYTDFEGLCDLIAVEDVHSWSAGFQQETTAKSTAVTPKVACPFPLFSFAVNYDGTVSDCQEDWTRHNIIGNLNRQTVREIWRGRSRKAFIRNHLMGLRAYLPACADCSYIQYCPDNVDDCRDELLEAL